MNSRFTKEEIEALQPLFAFQCEITEIEDLSDGHIPEARTLMSPVPETAKLLLKQNESGASIFGFVAAKL